MTSGTPGFYVCKQIYQGGLSLVHTECGSPWHEMPNSGMLSVSSGLLLSSANESNSETAACLWPRERMLVGRLISAPEVSGRQLFSLSHLSRRTTLFPTNRGVAAHCHYGSHHCHWVLQQLTHLGALSLHPSLGYQQTGITLGAGILTTSEKEWTLQKASRLSSREVRHWGHTPFYWPMT